MNKIPGKVYPIKTQLEPAQRIKKVLEAVQFYYHTVISIKTKHLKISMASQIDHIIKFQ
jgi:hypothetical protein